MEGAGATHLWSGSYSTEWRDESWVLFQGQLCPESIPGTLVWKAWIHHEWDASPLQDTTHSQSTNWNFFGRKPENPEETQTQAELAQRLHSDSNLSSELNWEPWSCEVTMITSAPTNCPWSHLINYFLLQFNYVSHLKNA